MDEQQAFRAIRNAIRLESIGRDAAAKVTPQLVEVMKQVRELVKGLPEETLLRDMQYRRMMQQLAPMFRGLNDSFFQTLSATLREEVIEQVKYAEKFLDLADDTPTGITTIETVTPQVKSLSKGAAGFGETWKPAVTSALSPGNFELGSGITRTQLMALTDETEVLGKRLAKLFEWSLEEGSPYTAAQIKQIDRTVKQGFLTGATNEQIARDLVKATNAGVRNTRAIARTAVHDMSQRANNRFWDANSSRIKLWEYDATFDYRVCPQCYPYDGIRKEKRSELPTVPRHPSCRCRLLPLTATALALEKEDKREGMTASIVEVNKKERDAQGRVYKTKARVDGEKMFKSAREIKPAKAGQVPRMWDFIAQTTPDTRRAVLGDVRAAEFEYITSSNRGAKRKDLRDALMYVTNGDARSFAKAQRSRGRGR